MGDETTTTNVLLEVVTDYINPCIRKQYADDDWWEQCRTCIHLQQWISFPRHFVEKYVYTCDYYTNDEGKCEHYQKFDYFEEFEKNLRRI